MRSTLETEAETGVEDRPSRRAALRVVVFVLAFVGAIGAMVGAAWVYGGRDGATPMDMGTEEMGAMDMGAGTAHASAAPLPETVAGLPMVEAITGPEARCRCCTGPTSRSSGRRWDATRARTGARRCGRAAPGTAPLPWR